jgi:hypothetical protein
MFGPHKIPSCATDGRAPGQESASVRELRYRYAGFVSRHSEIGKVATEGDDFVVPPHRHRAIDRKAAVSEEGMNFAPRAEGIVLA